MHVTNNVCTLFMCQFSYKLKKKCGIVNTRTFFYWLLIVVFTYIIILLKKIYVFPIIFYGAPVEMETYTLKILHRDVNTNVCITF